MVALRTVVLTTSDPHCHCRWSSTKEKTFRVETLTRFARQWGKWGKRAHRRVWCVSGGGLPRGEDDSASRKVKLPQCEGVRCQVSDIRTQISDLRSQISGKIEFSSVHFRQTEYDRTYRIKNLRRIKKNLTCIALRHLRYSWWLW